MINTFDFDQVVDICIRRLEQDCDPQICKGKGLSRKVNPQELAFLKFLSSGSDELYAFYDNARIEAGKRWRKSMPLRGHHIDETGCVQNGWHGIGSTQIGDYPGGHRESSRVANPTQFPTFKKSTRLSEEDFYVLSGLDRHVLEESAFFGMNIPEAEKNRYCVNYLRHLHSNYQDALDRKNQLGGYLYIFKRFNQLIASLYPWLAVECDRQIKEKEKSQT